jgi:hypothetical protein
MGYPLSIWLGVLVALALPAAFFTFEYLIEKKEKYVTLTPLRVRRDPGNPEKLVFFDEEVSFDPRHEHYLKCAEVLLTLSSASLVLIPTLHVGTAILSRFAFSLVLLGFTVVYGLLFMALLTYFYEMFLFNPKTFNAFRSSLIFALGFTAFACFAIAYLWMAIVTAYAVAHGSLAAS